MRDRATQVQEDAEGPKRFGIGGGLGRGFAVAFALPPYLNHDKIASHISYGPEPRLTGNLHRHGE